MGHSDKNLLTIAILVIVALVVVWVLVSMKRKHDDDEDDGHRHRRRGHGKPDPVGGVVAETTAPGEITISWDPAPNAVSYRVYLNTCQGPCASGKSNKVSSCGDNCCPDQPCESCVSQTNYAQIAETEGTSIVVETCEPCVCYLIVPYNRDGDAGDCKEVRYAYPECLPPLIQGRVVSTNCNGTKIEWDCPRCCDSVDVLVDGNLFDNVSCDDTECILEPIPECIEIGLRCVSACGTGDITIIQQGSAPMGAMIAEAARFRAQPRRKFFPKGRKNQTQAPRKVAGRRYKL